MISKNELLETFNKAGLLAFEVDVGYSESGPGMVYFKSNSIEELIRFAEVNNIKAILYSYDFNNPEDYKITDEVLDECDERLVKAIKTKVKEYNQSTSTLDYTRPCEFYIYCAYQGCLFTVSQEDTWLEDMGILLCDEKLEELLDSCEDIIKEISAEDKNKHKELKDKLREYLLQDERFLLCTNQRLRLSFIRQFLREHKEYTAAFKDYYYESVEFVEMVWKIHKNKV